MTTKRISINGELFEWFDAEAMNLGIPLRQYIESILEEHLRGVIEYPLTEMMLAKGKMDRVSHERA